MLPVEVLVEPVLRQLDRMGVAASRDIKPLIDSVKARSRTILHVAEQVAVRLDPTRSRLDTKGEALVRKMGPAFAENLILASTALESVKPEDWRPDELLTTLKGVAEANRLKLGDVMQPVRVALTGSTVSEPVNELLVVVGAQTSLRTIKETAERLQGGLKPA